MSRRELASGLRAGDRPCNDRGKNQTPQCPSPGLWGCRSTVPPHQEGFISHGHVWGCGHLPTAWPLSADPPRSHGLRPSFVPEPSPLPSRPSPSLKWHSLPAVTSWLMGTEPSHSRFSCLVRRPDCREGGGQLGGVSVGRCPYEKFTRNNQRLPSFPLGEKPPQACCPGPCKNIGKCPHRFEENLAPGAGAWRLMHWAVLLGPGCKRSSGEIDEVSVNLKRTVQRGHSCRGLAGMAGRSERDGGP